MATRFYLTKNPPPLGAPRASKVPGVWDSGGQFVGDYEYPVAGSEGWATRIGAVIPSYSLTTDAVRAGPRKNVLVSSGTALVHKIAGQSVGTYLNHHQQAAGAVFSVQMDGVSAISGNALLTGGLTRNVSISSWGGKVSFFDNTLGPGLIGCAPRLFYVWRPSTQAIVGVVAEAYSVLHYWTQPFAWNNDSGPHFMAGADLFPNQHPYFTWGDGYHFYDVAGVQDGDLLCVEYWCGRTYANGSWGWDPWDKETYPDSIDGELGMFTNWNIPVGGAADAGLYTTQALGGYRSFFESSDDLGVVETPPRRSPQTSVGF